MLSKIISHSLKLNINSVLNNKRVVYSFGSSGHDDHHHDYSVHIDKQATWLKFRTSRRMACVEGIQDTHYPMKDPDDSDPFVHIKQNPSFSLQNLAYNDPYYHEDDHQLLVNEPHGYSSGSDPIDTRYDVVVPNVLTIAALMTALVAVLCLEESPSSEGRLYREKLAIDYVEGNLEKKNNQLNDIKDKIKSLKK